MCVCVCVIYIYILRSIITASNQGIICACMLFQPSCFILFFFLLTWLFSMKLVMMHDVTMTSRIY